MLGRIGQNDQNAEILTQNSEIQKVGAAKNNPYSSIDKALFIDETSISDDAMKLWERELDVNKFAKLVMSDPEDKTADELVMAGVLNGDFSIDDEDGLFELLSNDKFLKDIAG